MKHSSQKVTNQAAYWSRQIHMTNLNPLQNPCGEIFRPHVKFLMCGFVKITGFCLRKFPKNSRCDCTLMFQIWQQSYHKFSFFQI